MFFYIMGVVLVLTGVVFHKRHVKADLTLSNLNQLIYGNVIEKLSAVGLIRTEEVAVA